MKHTYNSKLLIAGCALVLLTACETTSDPVDPGLAVTRSIEKTVEKPFEIINLGQEEVPENMRKLTRPYVLSGTETCATVQAEIEKLNAFLGTDYFNGAKETSFEEKFADEVANVATGFIPYKGVIRFISGAKDREAAIRTATNLGNARRGYLHGWADTRGCPRT